MIKITNKYFHITTKDSSYIMFVNHYNQLENFYYGKKTNISIETIQKHEFPIKNFNTWLRDDEIIVDYDLRRTEVSTSGFGDYSKDTIRYSSEGETDESVFLEYEGYKLDESSGVITGMPHARDFDDILIITLYDKYRDVHIDLVYKVFDESNTITRSIVVKNGNKQKIKLSTIGSISMQLPDGNDNIMFKHGGWVQESAVTKTKLTNNKFHLESNNGVTNEKNSPFIALSNKEFSDFNGEIYSVNLIYSTNWELIAEKNQYDKIRLTGGINSESFLWQLNKGEKFESPEATMTFSIGGINGMRKNHNNFVKRHIIRQEWVEHKRPANANSWEAMYFDVSHDKIVNLSDSASKLGFKLLILDDGWFGNRNDDKTSLGDWELNKDKFPHGLSKLALDVNERGMDFGIWIEPEMISKKSKLFEDHPEWILETKNGPCVEGRFQHLLDYTNQDVVDFAYNWISNLLKSANIKYVKWDMNRKVSSVPNMGDHHKYVLGLYSLKQKLIDEFPDILFEGCSAGGQRFDMGILFYFPQIWTSDNTDARSRMSIQYGTSLVFPLSTIKAHISDIPNHQTKRSIGLKSRIDVSSFGIQGIEANVVTMSDEDSEKIKKHMLEYQNIQDSILSGEFMTVGIPEQDNYVMFVVRNNDHYRVMIFKHGDKGDDLDSIELPFLENGTYLINGEEYNTGTKFKLNNEQLVGENKTTILQIDKTKEEN